MKLKQFGDALRNSLAKIGENSPLEFLSFISALERHFHELGVPPEFKVALMTPYLSERCRKLLNRVSTTDASSYDFVKRYLLEQLRLVPSYFIDEFNKISKHGSETYKSFVSRLSTLLAYYLDSRKVDTFEGLCELIVVDRVKTTLSEGALGHLLRFEATLETQWADGTQLADVLDTYAANYDKHDKPKASGLGVSVVRNTTNVGVQNRSSSVSEPQKNVGTTESVLSTGTINSAPSNNSAPTKGEPKQASNTQCWRCRGFGHTRKQCTAMLTAIN